LLMWDIVGDLGGLLVWGLVGLLMWDIVGDLVGLLVWGLVGLLMWDMVGLLIVQVGRNLLMVLQGDPKELLVLRWDMVVLERNLLVVRKLLGLIWDMLWLKLIGVRVGWDLPRLEMVGRWDLLWRRSLLGKRVKWIVWRQHPGLMLLGWLVGRYIRQLELNKMAEF
jgi:hypothetical protein